MHSLDYPGLLRNVYQNFSNLPGFVLLESADKTRGRYDIFSAYPYDRIVLKNNASDVSAFRESFKERLTVRESVGDLPFQGGAIGYIAYDFGARLLGIESPAQGTLEDMPLLDLGLYDWAIIVDHHLKKVTFFSANEHPSTTGILEEVMYLWKKVDGSSATSSFDSEFSPLISKFEYKASFDAIHRNLKEGRAYQANFTQPFHAAFDGNAWELYERISLKNPVPFSAFMRTNDADILSFSPERFLMHDNGYLLTSPIKGSIGRSLNPEDDERLKHQLHSSVKNRAENIMIVDLLRNDLGKIAKPGSVNVSSLCEVQSFSAVHHLVSDVEAICRPELHFSEPFFSCFPGGSITGAPKLEAMKIIQEQERYARGIYCGSIAYFSHHGRFDSNIAIRTITAKEGILHLAAGGGIVIDSQWEDEYRECYTKIAAIIDGLK
jgi:para-aminobenzoate synthetase component I